MTMVNCQLFPKNVYFLLHSNEASIYQKQLRQLTTEIYNSLTYLSHEFIKPFFIVKELPYITYVMGIS